MDFSVLDWVLLGVISFFAIVGLFRGFSGQLGSLIGIIAALATGYFIYAPVLDTVRSGGWFTGEAMQKSASALAVFILSLIIFGLVRRIVARFASFLIPQPANALTGALVGIIKGSILVGILVGAGLVQTGRFSDGFFASRSIIVSMIGSLADSYMHGAEN
jgi:membrane protein required for colicin V production